MTKGITDRNDLEINEAFPHKICINLDRRPDRWKQMRRKFARHGIHSVRRFAALDGDTLNIPANWTHMPGAYGCLVSHLQVVCDARRRKLPYVLIFEDDVVFDPHLQEKFGAYSEQLPRDWDMLYFGALHKDEPVRITDNVSRITKANSTYAYALRDTVFDTFIELNRKAETVLDEACFVLQQQFNCYCFMPHLAWVETDYSDAQNRLERHWYLQESLVLFGAQTDRLLSDTTLIFAHGDSRPDESAIENLKYLVRYYSEYFSPHIEIVIVEQGAQPTLDPSTLPAGSKYLLLRDGGPFNRGRCFNEGARNSSPDRKLLIFSDSDIYMETLDFRANLRMCERYDCVTGFNEIIELSDAESLRLRLTNATRGINITKGPLRGSDGRPGFCHFISREAIRIMGGLDETQSGRTGPLMSPERMRQFRVFQSPGHVLRLPGNKSA